jgi:hypothetical protein
MTVDFEAEKDTHTPLKKRSEWVPINDVTWKLASTTDFTNTPASHGKWGGYRSGRALAWVMNVGAVVGAPGHQGWLARCGDRSVGPTTIGKAKAAAVAMVNDPGMGKRIDDPVRHLNRLQARLVDTES